MTKNKYKLLKGLQMLKDFNKLLKVMEPCPATGWAGLPTYLMHLMNGTIIDKYSIFVTLFRKFNL